MPSLHIRTATAALVLAMLATGAEANEPFYKGKRLSVLINYGAGGPADIEGRLFARHIGKHIDGNPNVIVQNIDGAGGLIGTTYLGEIAPRDGTMMGHLTGIGWRWAHRSRALPRRFLDLRVPRLPDQHDGRVHAHRRAARHQGRDRHRQGAEPDLRRARPGQRQGPARSGSALDLLGIPHRHVTSYRSSAHARLALQQGEINFYSESPPSYRAVVHPGIVKEGLAIPVWHEAERRRLVAAKPVADLAIAPFDEVYQGGEGQAAGRAAVGRVPDRSGPSAAP